MTLRYVLAALFVTTLAACNGGADNASLNGKRQSVPEQKAQSASAYATVVQQLYISYFGRPADPGGLANFGAALAAANAPTDIQNLAAAYNTNPAVKTLIDSFGTSKESATLYGSGTTTQFVVAIYQNVLGRLPAQSGLDFWVTAIDSGSLTRGNAALSIMAGALANSTTQGKQDAQLIDNHIAVAESFTADLTTSAQINSYSGSSAAGLARNMIAAVDGSASLGSFANNTILTVAQIYVVAEATSGKLPGNTSGLKNGMTFNPSSVVMSTTQSSLNTELEFSIFATPTAGSDFSIPTSSQQGAWGYIADDKGMFTPWVTMYLSQDGTSFYPLVQLLNTDLIAAGHYQGNFLLQLCYDRLCTQPYPGSPWSFPYDLTVAPPPIPVLAGGGNRFVGHKDGTGLAASFGYLGGMTTDSAGNIYATDYTYLREITPAGVVTTIAGGPNVGSADGTGMFAQFDALVGIGIDSKGNLFASDSGNKTIRKITPQGVVTTVAGGTSDFYYPAQIAVDASDNVYIADSFQVHKLTSAGVLTSISQWSASVAPGIFQVQVAGVAVDKAGNLFVADTQYHQIVKVTPGGAQSVFYSGGSAAFAPQSLAFDPAGNLLVVNGSVISKITPGGAMTTLVSQGITLVSGLTVDANGVLYLGQGNQILKP